MTIHYSKSTGGFYDSAIHAAIPEDAVELTAEAHFVLFEGQAKGKVILSDDNGNPVLSDPVDNRTYSEKRAADYPSIGDQLDALWKGGNVAANMREIVQSIKDKYPKPE